MLYGLAGPQGSASDANVNLSLSGDYVDAVVSQAQAQAGESGLCGAEAGLDGVDAAAEGDAWWDSPAVCEAMRALLGPVVEVLDMSAVPLDLLDGIVLRYRLLSDAQLAAVYR